MECFRSICNHVSNPEIIILCFLVWNRLIKNSSLNSVNFSAINHTIYYSFQYSTCLISPLTKHAFTVTRNRVKQCGWLHSMRNSGHIQACVRVTREVQSRKAVPRVVYWFERGGFLVLTGMPRPVLGESCTTSIKDFAIFPPHQKKKKKKKPTFGLKLRLTNLGGVASLI